MNQTKNGDTYQDWIYKNGFWINQKTKQESTFHPQAMEIGYVIYKAYERLTPKKKGNRK